MSDETNLSDSITRLIEMVEQLHVQVARMDEHIRAMDERQRTIMVGWNAFLKNAEGQIRHVFGGKVPPFMLKKLLQTAFKGIEDIERKGR